MLEKQSKPSKSNCRIFKNTKSKIRLRGQYSQKISQMRDFLFYYVLVIISF